MGFTETAAAEQEISGRPEGLPLISCLATRFSTTTCSCPSVTVTKQLFECRSIPLYFILASSKENLQTSLYPRHLTAAGGRIDEFQKSKQRFAPDGVWIAALLRFGE
jgi:hypothetical protein